MRHKCRREPLFLELRKGTRRFELGDIVVTARKRSERMIDVPETISAFSDASLQKAGITNIDKLGQAVPNVVLNRRGDNEPNVVIRGRQPVS